MATKEQNGASGRMNLYHYFYESSSGHVDDSEDISLKAKDEKIIQLIESKSHSEMFKNSRNSCDEEIYEIEVDKLIELIKQNGEKVK